MTNGPKPAAAKGSVQDNKNICVGRVCGTPLQILEPQPSNRYNLAFHSTFGKGQAHLKRGKAYLTAYHQDFPKALSKEQIWGPKNSRSRICCECHWIGPASSLVDMLSKIEKFVKKKKNVGGNVEKKFGTIVVFAHGNPGGLCLPIANGGKVALGSKYLAGVFQNIETIGKKCPKDWKKKDWKIYRWQAKLLSKEIKRFQGVCKSWFDKETLIKVWACRVGVEPDGKEPDLLKSLGNFLLGEGSQVTLEAPKYYVEANYHWHTNTGSVGDRLSRFNEWKQLNSFHPDVITQAESDKNTIRLKGEGLNKGREGLIKAILREAPAPKGEKCRWIPFVSLKEERNYGETINMGSPEMIQNRNKYWRKVTIGRYCMHCGALMDFTAKVCPKCRKAAPSEAKPTTCGRCNSLIPAAAKFCRRCGTDQEEFKKIGIITL